MKHRGSSSNRVVYRDSKTGRFASRATWNRSRAHGGKRFRRQFIRAPRPKAPPKKPEPARLPAGEHPIKVVATRGKKNKAGNSLMIDARLITSRPFTREQMVLGLQRMAEGKAPAGMELKTVTYGHGSATEKESVDAAKDLVNMAPAVLSPESIKVEE